MAITEVVVVQTPKIGKQKYYSSLASLKSIFRLLYFIWHKTQRYCKIKSRDSYHAELPWSFTRWPCYKRKSSALFVPEKWTVDCSLSTHCDIILTLDCIYDFGWSANQEPRRLPKGWQAVSLQMIAALDPRSIPLVGFHFHRTFRLLSSFSLFLLHNAPPSQCFSPKGHVQ